MKKQVYIFLLILFSILPGLLLSQHSLEPVGGVFGGTVNCLYTTKQGTTYAGTHGGVYKLNNDTEAWEIKSNGIIFSGWQSRIHAIIEVNGVLLAGSNYLQGIYVSKDEGETWEVRSNTDNENEPGNIEAFKYARYRGMDIVYAVNANDFYKSEDGGENWQLLHTNYSWRGAPLAIAADGDLFCGSGRSGLSMFKASLENDTVWSFFEVPYGSGAYTNLFPYGTDTVFAIFKGYNGSHVILQSKEDGKEGTWLPIKKAFGSDSTNILFIEHDDAQNLYAVAGSGSIYRSGDGGKTWDAFMAAYGIESKSAGIENSDGKFKSAYEANNINASAIDFNFAEYVKAYYGSETGVHEGILSGQRVTLQQHNAGLNALTIKHGKSHGGNIVVSAENGINFLAANESFALLPILFPTKSITTHPNLDNLILGGYEGLVQLNQDKIKIMETEGLPENPKISAIAYGTGVEPKLYAGYNDGVCKIGVSSDNGQTWNHLADIDEFYEPSCFVEYNGKLAVTTNEGPNIAFVDLQNPEEVTYEQATNVKWANFDQVISYDGKLIASGWGALVMKEGPDEAFKALHEYEPESQNYLNDFDITGDRMWGTFSQGISEYNYATDKWKDVEIDFKQMERNEAIQALVDRFAIDWSPGLTEKSAQAENLTFYISFIYGGLWKTTLGSETSVREVNDTSMASIYPNPTKGNATIFFQLSGTQEVKIGIFNMQGQRVRTLADQQLSAGDYRYVWDGKDASGIPLPAGQYMLNVTKGDEHENQKVILLQAH